MAQILLAEDDSVVADLTARLLQGAGYLVRVFESAEDGIQAAQVDRYDLVITDLVMKGTLTGLDFIKHLRNTRPSLPVILFTANGSPDVAIKSAQIGAFDYLMKPFKGLDLLALVKRALDDGSNGETKVADQTAEPIGDIIGKSRAMQEVCKSIGRLAGQPINVLIRGATGTGKELVARALHNYSNRSNHPFVALNCLAIPQTLLESELFGHERGAFTGAISRYCGKFEQAHKGTLFLDEIGDVSLETQGKLLRVLQERCVQRLGGHETVHVDVRVIAATNRDFDKAIKEKAFREDLYYRLNTSVIHIPPLRDRKEDIPELVQHFLNQVAKRANTSRKSVTLPALEILTDYYWPGNVRELENVVSRAAVMARGSTITCEMARAALDTGADKSKEHLAPQQQTISLAEKISELLDRAEFNNQVDVYDALLDLVERELYTQAAERTQGNLSKISDWLGVSRPTARQKLVRYRFSAQKPDSTNASEETQKSAN